MCHYIDSKGRDDKQVLKLAYINALYQSGKTNSIDSAIIKCVDENKSLIEGPLGEKVAEIPFNFERRRSSCIIRTPTGKLLLICKGAFEERSTLCTAACYGLGTSPVNSEEVKAAINQRVRAYNNDGYRVIAVATKQLNDWDMTDVDSMDELESSMKLVGLLTFLDPPKDDAATSIAQLHNLGVEVKVLTGDNLGVAMKVSRSLNLVRYLDEEGAQAISGPALARMDSNEFDSATKTCKIFAKLTPSQKGDVILSLKKAGENVGMLGDGINDCVALRFADAGISVDTGAPVAKSCADGEPPCQSTLLDITNNNSYSHAQRTQHCRRLRDHRTANPWQYDQIHQNGCVLQLRQCLLRPHRFRLAALQPYELPSDTHPELAVRHLADRHSVGPHGRRIPSHSQALGRQGPSAFHCRVGSDQ